MDTESLDDQLRVLSRLSSQARTATHRLEWRQAMLVRGQRIARVLRMLPRVLGGEPFTRTKTQPGWDVFVGDTLVLFVETFTHGKSVEDLQKPIVVRVVGTCSVNTEPLEKLELRGEIIIVECAV